MVRFKICCIASVDEARLAVEAGASAVGLVSAMPSGPGPIPEPLIARIASAVPPGVATFLLTCLTEPEAIIGQHRRCRTSAVQLCDRLPGGTAALAALREGLPGIGIVQVVHVRDGTALDEARAAAPGVDAILLDSGRPDAPVKELGGTGRVHDWSISRRIREELPVPVYLAGGLGPDNVGAAVRAVEPFAVDVCSGVRTAGRLDPEKLARFVRRLSGPA